MKTFKLLSLLFLAITYVSCSNHSDTAKRIGYDGDIYGNIEKLTITEHSLTTKFGESRIDTTLTMTVISFNPNGDVSKVEEYEPFTTLIEGGTWTGTHLPNKRLISVSKYTYDDDSLTKFDLYDKNGELSYSILYSYSESGKLIEKTQYSSNGDIDYKIQYYYSDDLLTEVESSSFHTEYSLNNGKVEKNQRESCLRTMYTYQYDKRNKLLHKDEVQYYKHDIKIERCDTTVLSYDYDAKGNLVLESRFDESLVYPSVVCKNYYNKHFKLVESVQLNNLGEIQSKYTFHYDKKKRLIEKNEYGPKDEFICKWVCENDNHGNIIRITKFEGVLQTPTLLVKADFVYRK